MVARARADVPAVGSLSTLHPAIDVVLEHAAAVGVDTGTLAHLDERAAGVPTTPRGSVFVALMAADYVHYPGDVIGRMARKLVLGWLSGDEAVDDAREVAADLGRAIPFVAAALATMEGADHPISPIEELRRGGTSFDGKIADWVPDECRDWDALGIILSLNAARASLETVVRAADHSDPGEVATAARAAAVSATLAVEARARRFRLPVEPQLIELIDRLSSTAIR